MHTEELHNFSSLYIFREITSRRTKLEEHVALTGKMRSYKIRWGGALCVDGSVISVSLSRRPLFRGVSKVPDIACRHRLLPKFFVHGKQPQTKQRMRSQYK
jgi:hypothetical protein